MEHVCKICTGQVVPRHTIAATIYYYCPACQFLQNFYWEERADAVTNQVIANDTARADRWPAGQPAYMREVGWEALTVMYWPLRWHTRKVHQLLTHVPGYTALAHRFIKKQARRLLDFGCGHGTTVLELAKNNQFDAYGLDPFSPTENPRILRTSLLETGFPAQSFDGIFSIETLEHITNPVETFTELNRILKPTGVLLVQTHRLETAAYQQKQEKWLYLQDPSTHVSIYSEPAFRDLAKRTGWQSVSFKGTKLARFIK